MRKKIEPVFIAGCGRSGTTFLRFILNCNNEIFIPNECGFFIDYLKFGQFVPKLILKNLFFNEPQLKLWNDQIHEINNIADSIKRLHVYKASLFDCKTWGQKTPKFIRHMNLFEQHFGRIRWILIYRDPRAVISSILKSERHTYSIYRAIKRWKNDNKVIIKLKIDGLRENTLIVKYEDIVKHYDHQSEILFSFSNLKKVSISDLKKKGKPNKYLDGSKVRNITVYKTFIPNEESLYKWKKDLSMEQILLIEKKCAKEMQTLGYIPISKESRTPISVKVKDIFNHFKIIKIVAIFLKNWPLLPFYTVTRKIILYLYYVKSVF